MPKLTVHDLELFDILERVEGDPLMLQITNCGPKKEDQMLFWTKEGAIETDSGVDKDGVEYFQERAFGKFSEYGEEKKGLLVVYNWLCPCDQSWSSTINFSLYKNREWGDNRILAGRNKKQVMKDLKI